MPQAVPSSPPGVAVREWPVRRPVLLCAETLIRHLSGETWRELSRKPEDGGDAIFSISECTGKDSSVARGATGLLNSHVGSVENGVDGVQGHQVDGSLRWRWRRRSVFVRRMLFPGS